MAVSDAQRRAIFARLKGKVAGVFTAGRTALKRENIASKRGKIGLGLGLGLGFGATTLGIGAYLIGRPMLQARLASHYMNKAVSYKDKLTTVLGSLSRLGKIPANRTLPLPIGHTLGNPKIVSDNLSRYLKYGKRPTEMRSLLSKGRYHQRLSRAYGKSANQLVGKLTERLQDASFTDKLRGIQLAGGILGGGIGNVIGGHLNAKKSKNKGMK